MINLRMLKLSDPLLWIAVSLLMVMGLFAIFSTTFSMQIKLDSNPFLYVNRQLISLLVGMLGLILFAYLDFKRLKRFAPLLYVIMLFLLVMVLFVSGQGAQRWFQIGIFSFQPSELSKILMIITLAAYLSEHKRLFGLGGNLFLLVMAGLPFLLIFKQPDLGTALVFISILVGLLIASWSSPKLLVFILTPMVSILFRPLLLLWLIYLLAMALALFLSRAVFWDWMFIWGGNIGVGIAMPFIWGILKPYQRQRIISFLDPNADPYGAGYHSLQSKIAIGSGGIFGKGFLRGTQTQLQFIPEQHSDFIFSAIGEEFGFIGAAAVLILFAIVIWRCVTIAGESSDDFGCFLASGIAAMTAFHVLANIGMTLGLLPVVGIPLPFVSYGGSSLLMNLVAVGILQSISMRRQKLIF